MSAGPEAVVIFGKDSCPYTQAALAAYEAAGTVTYVNVKRDPAGLTRMLEYSGGQRRVPVIVIGDRVTIGYGGT
jgi:glutaredoxin 3